MRRKTGDVIGSSTSLPSSRRVCPYASCPLVGLAAFDSVALALLLGDGEPNSQRESVAILPRVVAIARHDVCANVGDRAKLCETVQGVTAKSAGLYSHDDRARPDGLHE